MNVSIVFKVNDCNKVVTLTAGLLAVVLIAIRLAEAGAALLSLKLPAPGSAIVVDV